GRLLSGDLHSRSPWCPRGFQSSPLEPNPTAAREEPTALVEHGCAHAPCRRLNSSDRHHPTRSGDQAGSVTIRRIGVGLKPLHGLRVCGQFETTASTSISARRSTWSPGFESPSTIPIVPSGATGTFMKKLRLATTSRRPRPKGASARRKLARQLGVSLTP